jgi:hypothetical protein
MEWESTLVWWKVRCLNRKDHTFSDRTLLLDPSSLSPEDQSRLLRLIEHSSTHPAIREFRGRFQEVTEEEFVRRAHQATAFKGVFLQEYFEEEEGRPMGVIELMQALTGEANPIILGNPESVLRLGPAGIREKDRWSVRCANDIAHLLQLVEQIARSDWLSSPLSLQFVPGKNDIKRIISFEHPDAEATRAVLLPIRQLYSEDEAFNHACNRYLRHVADGRKHAWVKERKDGFNRSRDSEPFQFKVWSLSTRQVLDLFMYGSGLVHRKADKGQETELSRAVSEYGREHVVMAFNLCCRDLCQYAFDMYHVIRQDFQNWISTERCVGPDKVFAHDLLG